SKECQPVMHSNRLCVRERFAASRESSGSRDRVVFICKPRLAGREQISAAFASIVGRDVCQGRPGQGEWKKEMGFLGADQ
ncbi:hypothetical protein AVEN_44294-2-1, partial [Araneus ventricosus]